MTRLPATARDGIVETPFGLLEAAPPSAGDLVVCVRPEAIRIGADGFSLGEARVTDTAFFGTHNRVHLVADAVPDLTIVAYLAPAERVAEGDIVPLAADPASIRVFPAR
ncbi:MAG: TOBE domain-containing protein [Pseudomonadota bacterium]